MREYTVVIERGEDGFLIGSVPAFPGCHTQGRSLEELLEHIREAIALWIESFGDEGDEPAEFVGIHRVAV